MMALLGSATPSSTSSFGSSCKPQPADCLLYLRLVGDRRDRCVAWVRDPDKAQIGSFDEPSSKLRKILRTIGDFTISRTGDIPGFAVVSSRDRSAGRRSGSGDAFICMQVQPAPVANPDMATSPPIEVPQTKAGQDGAERVQKVSSARIRL